MKHCVQVGHQGEPGLPAATRYAALVDGPEAEVNEDEDGSMSERAGSGGGDDQYLLRPPPQLAPPEDVRLDVRRRRRRRKTWVKSTHCQQESSVGGEGVRTRTRTRTMAADDHLHQKILFSSSREVLRLC